MSLAASPEHLSLTVFAARGGLRSLHRTSKPLTETALCEWIATAQVGESLQYHEGLLWRDRSQTDSTLTAKERARIHATACRAWIACEQGLVHLFSVRIADGRYRYLAIRSGRVLKPPDKRDTPEPNAIDLTHPCFSKKEMNDEH